MPALNLQGVSLQPLVPGIAALLEEPWRKSGSLHRLSANVGICHMTT